jgi:hypothetical protein
MNKNHYSSTFIMALDVSTEKSQLLPDYMVSHFVRRHSRECIKALTQKSMCIQNVTTQLGMTSQHAGWATKLYCNMVTRLCWRPWRVQFSPFTSRWQKRFLNVDKNVKNTTLECPIVFPAIWCNSHIYRRSVLLSNRITSTSDRTN